MELIIKNIRCFSGKHIIPIKPITILIGENSTGKSTVLACLDVISAKRGFPYHLDFNRYPYSLGTFDDIITQKKGNNQLKHFELGYNLELGEAPSKNNGAQNETIQVRAQFFKHQEIPDMLNYSISSPFGALNIYTNEDNKTQTIDMKYIDDWDPKATTRGSVSMDQALLQEIKLVYDYATPENLKDSATNKELLTALIVQLNSRKFSNVPISIGPTRTKPKRTYHRFTDSTDYSGGDIPLLLARYLKKSFSTKDSKLLIRALSTFGIESGLFKEINVKTFGTKTSDPFQVLVNMAGFLANLIDVGYGVSQSLPIIVESTLATNSILLLQQPEIHLHPKAQAALGSFFVKQSKLNNGNTYIIETHSDYLLDRVRIEIAEGKIAASEVAVLYFDKKIKNSKVHTIELDENGNIINAPGSFRDFFIKEDLNLLRRTSR